MERSIEALQEAMREFARARDWDQFHSPKNLATALSVEAAELLASSPHHSNLWTSVRQKVPEVFANKHHPLIRNPVAVGVLILVEHDQPALRA